MKAESSQDPAEAEPNPNPTFKPKSSRNPPKIQPKPEKPAEPKPAEAPASPGWQLTVRALSSALPDPDPLAPAPGGPEGPPEGDVPQKSNETMTSGKS